MTYVMSDIHGELSLFLKLMNKIRFSNKDELYVCGDIIEKGDASVRLARLILSKPNVHCIRGNHEEAFLNYYYSLMRETEDYDEVLEQLREYIQGDGHLLDWDLVEKLEELPYYIETDSFICVHAGVPLDEDGKVPPLDTIPPEELLYNRKFKNPDLLPKDSKCVFFGHTSTACIFPDAKILTYLRDGADVTDFKNYIKVHLDTGAFTSGLLGCFCIDTCKTYFATKR